MGQTVVVAVIGRVVRVDVAVAAGIGDAVAAVAAVVVVGGVVAGVGSVVVVVVGAAVAGTVVRQVEAVGGVGASDGRL